MKQKGKRSIYFRTFAAMTAIYLVLMTAFSIFLVRQEVKVNGLELGALGVQANYQVGEILAQHLDNDENLVNFPAIRKDFINKSFFLGGTQAEIAVFSGNFEPIVVPNDYWICNYTESTDGTRHYTGYAYLNLNDWFDEKTVRELEKYYKARPKAQKAGDLTEYSIELSGFWLDNEMVIPEKIGITPMYASGFNEEGDVNSASGTKREDLTYRTDYINTKELPYFKDGGILPESYDMATSGTRKALREMVSDPARLEKAAATADGFSSIERVKGAVYRYYCVIPYENTVTDTENGDGLYSTAWTVIARDVDILEYCGDTMAFVWGSCLIIFFAAAFILSSQLYKTYQKEEAIQWLRRETANAMAHDLKTPLSILSGYAQNLMEQINSEKRVRYAEGIQANVERMDKILREMLEMTRMEGDKPKLNLEEISLRLMTFEILNRYRAICEERGIKLEAAGDGIVTGDRLLLLRVIDNFFINALDHTPDKGTIQITITDHMFELFNSGSHIDENRLDAIWEPYVKGDGSRGGTKGTGLGLSIVRSVLELHHFSYRAENRENGVAFLFEYADSVKGKMKRRS